MSWWEQEEEAYQSDLYLQALQKLDDARVLTPEQKRELIKELEQDQKKADRQAAFLLLGLFVIVAVAVGVYFLV